MSSKKTRTKQLDLPKPRRIGSPKNQILGEQQRQRRAARIAAGADTRAKRTIARRTKDSTPIRVASRDK